MSAKLRVCLSVHVANVEPALQIHSDSGYHIACSSSLNKDDSVAFYHGNMALSVLTLVVLSVSYSGSDYYSHYFTASSFEPSLKP